MIGGGAERMLSGVAAALAGGGHRVLGVTTRSTPFGYGDRSGWFEEAGVELFELPSLLPQREWLDFLDRLIVEEGVDVLWQTGSIYIYRALPALRARHPRLRIIDSLFNNDVHIERHLASRDLIDLAIVESVEVQRGLIAAGADPDRLVRIPNGVDTARFQPNDTIRASASTFDVGFVGRLAEEKNPFAFVDLAAGCRRLPISFHVAGDGPLAGAVRRRARRRRVGNSLLMHGFVENIAELYGRLDALVVPSRLDGRPNAVLESMAMGVPVLASPVGALTELVADGVNGFVCDSVADFGERLRWLQAHPGESLRMRAAARDTAVRQFDVRPGHRRYEQIIAGLLDDHRETALHA